MILEFIRRYPKACACLSDCRGSTIINAALLSHGCEIYPITEGLAGTDPDPDRRSGVARCFAR